MSLPMSPIEQVDPPLSPQKTLPTMYDLPSEDSEEPGVPDEYHILQPELLSAGFCPQNYAADEIFVASDLNLYYDPHHPNWYKRPDWFAVLGVSRLYNNRELRLSYVNWQEGIRPHVVIELLSPGTRDEDLGRRERRTQQPTKWQVYEQILGIPYYILFDRYTDELQIFQLEGGYYQLLELTEPKIWLPHLEIGLGLWLGDYRGITRNWLRWSDVQGNWIPTPAERERQEKELAQQQLEQERQEKELTRQQLEQERQEKELTQQQLEQERQRIERLAERLRQAGINPDEI